MSNPTLARLRTCAVVLASVWAASLAVAGAAQAATFSVTTAAQLEEAVTSANANTEANTIVLAGGSYLPGPKALKLTNTHGLQTLEGPTHTPEAVIGGTNIEVENPELLIVAAGVSAKIKNLVLGHAGGAASPGIEDLGTLSVEASTLAGNQGVALLVQASGTATLLNSTISDGAALGLVNQGSSTLKNVTVALNKGEGIENAGTLSLTNTIIAKNGAPQCKGTAATTNDHNLSSDATCGAEKSSVDPLLSTLFNDGGPTEFHSLKPASPAQDAGDSAQCPTTDQRGIARPDDAATACDIGADEFNATPPSITVPGEIKTPATSNSGAVVTYSASASSTDDVVRSFSCVPPSGSTFPIGTTTVVCTAIDGHETKATASFRVVVTAPLAFFSNFVLLSTSHAGVVGWGPVKLVSPALEVELECVQLAFGSAFNEGSPVRSGRGEILGFSAAGNATVGGTEPNRKCKFKKGTAEVEAWATDEPALVQTGTVGKRGEPLTVPWNVELRCGEREEEQTPVIRIGVPTGTAPITACKTEAEEKTEIEKEETERKGCYASPVPAGCVKVNIVQPSLALETIFEGSLRPKAINGFGTGLNASKWKFEGEASGKLRLSTAFATSGTATGEVKNEGFGSSELIQAK